MFWLSHLLFDDYPHQRRVWIKVRFLHETDKAVLVMSEGDKAWIPKSKIRKVRIKNNWFEVYVRA